MTKQPDARGEQDGASESRTEPSNSAEATVAEPVREAVDLLLMRYVSDGG